MFMALESLDITVAACLQQAKHAQAMLGLMTGGQPHRSSNRLSTTRPLQGIGKHGVGKQAVHPFHLSSLYWSCCVQQSWSFHQGTAGSRATEWTRCPQRTTCPQGSRCSSARRTPGGRLRRIRGCGPKAACRCLVRSVVVAGRCTASMVHVGPLPTSHTCGSASRSPDTRSGLVGDQGRFCPCQRAQQPALN